MKLQSLIVAALFAIAVPAAAAPLSQQDAGYLTSAMQAQLGRYALATLAARAGSGAVQSYARSVVKDASANTLMLDAIAKRDGVPIPKGPSTLDEYHYSQLQGLRGSQLNQRFVDDLRVDDGMEQGNVNTEMSSGQDPSIKAFAKRRYVAMQHEAAQLKHL
jgi:putative membrane protein